MKLTRAIVGLALGAAIALYACVGGDDSTKPPDGGSDATVADVTQDGAQCDGAICNGVCVETSSDSKNCGRCAHTCGTAQCSAGACQPVLIDGTEDAGVEAGVISSLTTDQGDDNPTGQALHIFWAMTGGNNGVLEDNATGGNVVKLSTTATTSLTNVAVNGSTANWFVENTVGVQQPVLKGQVNTAGSQSAGGTINGSAIQSILVDPTSKNVFGSYAVNTTTVGAFKCVSGTCTMVMSQAGQPAGNVATDGTHFYFCDPGNGVIMQVTFTGNSAPFISNQASPNLLRVDGSNLYWFNGGTKTISSGALTAPTPKQVATAATAADAIAADAVNVYWTESATGTVNYAPITGAGPTTPYVKLGTSASPMRLVRDTGFLYFTHNEAIYSVVLP